MGLFGKKLVFNRKVAKAVEKLTNGDTNAVTGAKALAQALGIKNTVAKEVGDEIRRRNTIINENNNQIVENAKTIKNLQRDNAVLTESIEYNKERSQDALTEKDQWAW